MVEGRVKSPRDFIREVILMAQEGCDVDGADIQEWAVAAGILRAVEVSEPCGEDCACEEWNGGFFPTTCYRFTDEYAAPPRDTSALTRALQNWLAAREVATEAHDRAIAAYNREPPAYVERVAEAHAVEAERSAESELTRAALAYLATPSGETSVSGAALPEPPVTEGNPLREWAGKWYPMLAGRVVALGQLGETKAQQQWALCVEELYDALHPTAAAPLPLQREAPNA